MKRVVVVVPNWNGAEDLPSCLASLQAQSVPVQIIVVDNGSVDSSVQLLEQCYPGVILIKHAVNKGYAGGINPGFRWAIEHDYTYAATFNNDAVADKDWIKHLTAHMDQHPETGIAAAKLLDGTGRHIDSTGESYSNWGLPFPRGRGEANVNAYDQQTSVLGASGGSSLYRVSMLQQIGLLDEDFFAYYEDVDISLRAQLAGWKIGYVPAAEVRHQIGTTSQRVKGFYAYQTIKNYPWLLVKNMPASVFWRILPRFLLAYTLIITRTIQRGQLLVAAKAFFVMCVLLPKKLAQRWHIQSTRTVPPSYIWNIMTHDLPPQASGLRALRSKWQKLKGKT